VAEKPFERRTRRRRPRSVGEWLTNVLANPRLPKRQRLERIAIVVVFLLVGMYLLISPMISKYFAGSPKAPAAQAPPPGKSKGAVAPK
jgi:hypothetical protein